MLKPDKLKRAVTRAMDLPVVKVGFPPASLAAPEDGMRIIAVIGDRRPSGNVPGRGPAPSHAKEDSRDMSGAESDAYASEDHIIQIREELQRILRSKAFSKAYRLRHMLEHTVSCWLRGEAGLLTGRSLASTLFRRGKSFDSGSDNIVRVCAARLRKQLGRYYGGEGAQDILRIDLPAGTYIPVIERRKPSSLCVSGPGEARTPTVMVLPLHCAMSDTEGGLNCTEIYDHLIWLLTESSDTHVISRIFSDHLNLRQDLRLLRRRFGTHFVIAGTVTRAPEGRHLIVHLTETRTGYNIWSGYYELAGISIVDLSRRIVFDLLGEMRNSSDSAQYTTRRVRPDVCRDFSCNTAPKQAGHWRST